MPPPTPPPSAVPPYDAPSSPGPVRHTVGPLADAVAALVGDTLEGAPPPGALIAVAAGKAIAYASTGHARSGAVGVPPVPMEWATRTDAGSVSKVMGTTAALMTLTDTGRISVDDRAARYLPVPDPDIRLRDLLEHRAGLWEWWPLYLSAAPAAGAPVDASAALAFVGGLPQRHRPGAARHYSDLGFMLLGGVVARVGGGSLDRAVGELVLAPYGLTQTGYAAPTPGGPVAASSHGDGIERRMVTTGEPYPVTADADAFAGWRRHVLVGEVNDGNAFHAFGGVAGHAGLFTTATDLLRFGSALSDSLHGRGPIRRVTAELFATAGADPGQALGLRVWDGPWGRAIGHTGFPGVAVAALPEHGAAVAMITNRLHAAPTGSPESAQRTAFRPTEAMWQLVLSAADRHLTEREGP